MKNFHVAERSEKFYEIFQPLQLPTTHCLLIKAKFENKQNYIFMFAKTEAF